MDEEGQTNREANLKEAVRFWRAWKTVHQMCKDRVCDNKVPFTQAFCAPSRDHDRCWMRPWLWMNYRCDSRDGMLTGVARVGIRAHR